jgi:hypothetical protein
MGLFFSGSGLQKMAICAGNEAICKHENVSSKNALIIVQNNRQHGIEL